MDCETEYCEMCEDTYSKCNELDEPKYCIIDINTAETMEVIQGIYLYVNNKEYQSELILSFENNNLYNKLLELMPGLNLRIKCYGDILDIYCPKCTEILDEFIDKYNKKD